MQLQGTVRASSFCQCHPCTELPLLSKELSRSIFLRKGQNLSLATVSFWRGRALHSARALVIAEMELKRRRNKRRENLKGCQGALCLKQPRGMECGVQTLFYSPSSVCTKTVPWMLHGLPKREKRNENNTAAFPCYRSCLMTWAIRGCRAKVAIFHYQSHFNSAQSHLLVEGKR